MAQMNKEQLDAIQEKNDQKKLGCKSFEYEGTAQETQIKTLSGMGGFLRDPFGLGKAELRRELDLTRAKGKACLADADRYAQDELEKAKKPSKR